MNPLVCDLCGSNDVVKEGEYFVCKHCGTKYSVETAKQMMFGGHVSIDNSEQVNNYLTLALRSLDETNSTRPWYMKAREYIDKALELAPNDLKVRKAQVLVESKTIGAFFNQREEKEIEQYFRISKDVLECLGEEKTQFAQQAFELCKEGITEGVNGIRFDAYLVLLNAEKAKSCMLFINKVLGFWVENGVEKTSITPFKEEVVQRFLDYFAAQCDGFGYDNDAQTNPVLAQQRTMRDGLSSLAEATESESLKRTVYETLLKYEDKIRTNDSREYREKIVNKIKQGDPSYTEPSKSGCYVATAVYGSYDCPEVWTLRRFRDCDLAEIWYGRLFIRTYYAISPTIVKWFGHCKWFNYLWKPILDKMVKSLKAKGYEDTPYTDRNW